MKIAIDFDGTCTTHNYPLIGKDIGAIPVLQDLVVNRHQLILFTMRSGKKLDEAVKWFKDNDIKLYSIQKDKGQEEWTQSPKCYAQLYIDDAALGIPLVYDKEYTPRPYVHWGKIRTMLENRNILKIK